MAPTVFHTPTPLAANARGTTPVSACEARADGRQPPPLSPRSNAARSTLAAVRPVRVLPHRLLHLRLVGVRAGLAVIGVGLWRSRGGSYVGCGRVGHRPGESAGASEGPSAVCWRTARMPSHIAPARARLGMLLKTMMLLVLVIG